MSIVHQGSVSWIVHPAPGGVAWNVRADRNGKEVILRGGARTNAAAERDALAAIVAVVTGRRSV